MIKVQYDLKVCVFFSSFFSLEVSGAGVLFFCVFTDYTSVRVYLHSAA